MQPRERKPALAALAVLLILGGALVSGLLVIRSGHRSSVIVISQPVAPGQRIPLDAMREGQVAADGVDTVPWDQRGQVARYYAAVGLVPGTVLTHEMVAADGGALSGKVVVGLALKPGELPAGGVQRGDRVRVYAVGAGAAARPGAVLAGDALVYEVSQGGGDQFSNDATAISVAVSPDEAPAITQAAATGQVAVALLPPGSGVGEQAAAGPPQGAAGAAQGAAAGPPQGAATAAGSTRGGRRGLGGGRGTGG